MAQLVQGGRYTHIDGIHSYILVQKIALLALHSKLAT
jgi:hypothetical protein